MGTKHYFWIYKNAQNEDQPKSISYNKKRNCVNTYIFSNKYKNLCVDSSVQRFGNDSRVSLFKMKNKTKIYY